MQSTLSPRWLLFVVLGILLLSSQCFGGTLTWTPTENGEQLIFKFDSRLPDTSPKFHQPNKLIFPLNWGFWQGERKFKLPDLPSSALFQNIAYTPAEGIILTMSAQEFDFVFSTRPQSKEFVLDIWPLKSETQQNQDQPQTTNASQENTDGQSTDQQDAPQEEISPYNNLDDSKPTKSHASGIDPSLSNVTGMGPEIESEPVFHPEPVQEIPSEQSGFDQLFPQTEPEPEDLLSGMAQLRGKVHRLPGNDMEEERAALPVPPQGEEQQEQTPHDRFQENIFPQEILDVGQENASIEHQTPDQTDLGPEQDTQADQHQTEPRPEHEDLAIKDTPKPQADTQDQDPVDNTEDTVLALDESPDPQGEQFLEQDNATNLDAEANGTLVSTQEHDLSAEPSSVAAATTNADPTFFNATEIIDAAREVNATSAAELETLYQTLSLALADQDLATVKQTAQTMLNYPELPPELREDLLYTLADLEWNQGQNDVETNFRSMLLALEAAKNANLQSEKLPQILGKMGRLHLLVNNLPEAKAYFDLLRRRYPDDEHVPMLDIYWGEYYLSRGNYTKAHEYFQYVLQNHEDEYVQKRAHGGLIKTLAGLGFMERGQELVEKIQEKWPTFRLDDPSFLMTAGYISMMNNLLDQANKYLWAYINLVPNADDADLAWARIGDIYAQQGQLKTAKDMYQNTIRTHSEKEGALIAQMRLAEEGILDPTAIPSIDNLDMSPAKVYERIAQKKQSPLAPVAQLKLAMLYLWQKEYAQCLKETEHFAKEFPDHKLRTNAQEVAQTALQEWIVQELGNNNYALILDLWNQYGSLFEETGPTAQLSLILATAYQQEKKLQEALDMARPLVFGPLPKGEYSEPALDLMLSVLLELQDWEEIPKVAQQVATWHLPPERQQNINYATALALENLRDHDAACTLWLKLATDQDLSEIQRGYAHFFLAQSASMAGDFAQANVLAQEALDLLLKDKTDVIKIRDSLELLIELAEKTDQSQDALAWSLQYDDYLQKTDTTWPAHAWRKAILYKKNNNMPQWREHLEELIKLYPNSLHGRMATSELENMRLTKEAEKFH